MQDGVMPLHGIGVWGSAVPWTSGVIAIRWFSTRAALVGMTRNTVAPKNMTANNVASVRPNQ